MRKIIGMFLALIVLTSGVSVFSNEPAFKMNDASTIIVINGNAGELCENGEVTLLITETNTALMELGTEDVIYMAQSTADGDGEYFFRINLGDEYNTISSLNFDTYVNGELATPTLTRVEALTSLFGGSVKLSVNGETATASIDLMNTYMLSGYTCTAVIAAYSEDGALLGVHMEESLEILEAGLNEPVEYPSFPTDAVEARAFLVTDLTAMSPYLSVSSWIKPPPFIIANPYQYVDWDGGTWGQYKAGMHVHTQNSDGSGTIAQMAERHYELGYDVLSITDHNFTTNKWSAAHPGAMTTTREAEMFAGIGLNSDKRDGRPMYPIRYTNEQNVSGEHINTFFADYNANTFLETSINAVQGLGGISRINHPGRYTGGVNGGSTGEFYSNEPATVQKYADLFMKYDSCLGMEIINKLDNESRSDRILWDNILAQTMPQGRPVWGFSGDDTHGVNSVGFTFDVLLINKADFNQDGLIGIEETSASAYTALSVNNPIRKAMEGGAFYVVSRVARREDVKPSAPIMADLNQPSIDETLPWLLEPTPSITNIAVDETEGTITVEGADYGVVEWIADGVKIAEGNTLDLFAEAEHINSYVRAQLKSATGIAFTQPFGVTKTFNH